MSNFELKRNYDIRSHQDILAYSNQLKELPALVANKLKLRTATEPVTGLYNDWLFRGILPAEVTLAERLNLPVSLLLMDLDNFDQVLKTFGVTTGNKVIKIFGDMLKKVLQRETDIVFNLDSAHQYAAILPQTDIRQANKLGITINNIINQSPVGGRVLLTVSIGAASTEQSKQSERLFNSAHRNVITAKREGGNRTIIG